MAKEVKQTEAPAAKDDPFAREQDKIPPAAEQPAQPVVPAEILPEDHDYGAGGEPSTSGGEAEAKKRAK